MYGFVPVGGYVIFDDIGDQHPQVAQAWAEFMQDQGVAEEPCS